MIKYIHFRKSGGKRSIEDGIGKLTSAVCLHADSARSDKGRPFLTSVYCGVGLVWEEGREQRDELITGDGRICTASWKVEFNPRADEDDSDSNPSPTVLCLCAGTLLYAATGLWIQHLPCCSNDWRKCWILLLVCSFKSYVNILDENICLTVGWGKIHNLFDFNFHCFQTKKLNHAIIIRPTAVAPQNPYLKTLEYDQNTDDR